MTLKRIAAITLWVVGLIVYEAGSFAHWVSRGALRLAHRWDPTLEKFW